jgi:hypothetical protein
MTPEEWQRVKDVLVSALSLDTAAQLALLEQEFAENQDLRREAAELLTGFQLTTQRIPGLSSVFAGLAANASLAGLEAPSIEPPAPPPLLEPSDMCGRYKVVRLLGRGGMGSVYLANDTEIDTPVALKVLSEQLLESPDARIRLRLEAQNAAKLRGLPHIATFIELAHVEVKGRQFPVIVMEYVEGKSCAEHLADHPVSLRRALRWASQIAAAVDSAHDHGVLHCDLKPQNIQVGVDDNIKVLDFGVARALYGPTTAEHVTGTVAYMAPEQLKEKRFTESGDVYSLGVTLFELVTGRRPFAGADQRDLILEILGRPAPHLSTVLKDAPAPLDVLVGRMLAKGSRQRPQSLAEVRRELESLQAALDPPGPTAWQRALPKLKVIGTVLASLTFAGFVTSMAFNLALSRTGRFADESPLWWPVWGVRMLIAPVVVSGFSLLPVVLIVLAIRSAVSGVNWPRSVRAFFGWWSSASAAKLAVVVLLGSVLGVNLFVWRFEPGISALSALIGDASSEALPWLRPDNFDQHNLYRYVSFLLWTASACGWWIVARRRRRRLQGPGLLLSVLGGIVLSLALALWALPYRLLWQAERQRVQLAGESCYVTGRQMPDLLLFCPAVPPPRARIVNVNDPALKSGSDIEKIFTPLNDTSVD